ncbi:MAG TPA: hypothetical protein VN259_14430, partial [Xanthomonadales bacterium]|nr:hypothetical protein [Xanthomonadales bacterium]
MPIEVVVPRSHWLLVRLRENGSDWVLMARRDGWHLETDTAPSRLAIEHLTLPGRLFPTLEIDARSWSGDGLSKPEVEFSCVPWNASLPASMDLMWGGAWLVEFESAGGARAAARLDQRARAHFARVLNDASEPELLATAQHSVAYLMTRVGRRAAAAVAFDQAAQWWQLAGHRGAELAARFHAAQARLN